MKLYRLSLVHINTLLFGVASYFLLYITNLMVKEKAASTLTLTAFTKENLLPLVILFGFLLFGRRLKFLSRVLLVLFVASALGIMITITWNDFDKFILGILAVYGLLGYFQVLVWSSETSQVIYNPKFESNTIVAHSRIPVNVGVPLGDKEIVGIVSNCSERYIFCYFSPERNNFNSKAEFQQFLKEIVGKKMELTFNFEDLVFKSKAVVASSILWGIGFEMIEEVNNEWRELNELLVDRGLTE